MSDQHRWCHRHNEAPTQANQHISCALAGEVYALIPGPADFPVYGVYRPDWKERQARRIHAAVIWLGKRMGRIMTRLGLD